MAESTGSLGFPRWQVALAIGATTATIGMGYWYLRQSDKKPTLIDNKMNSLSIDDVSVQADEAPIVKAQRYKNEGNAFFKKGSFAEAIVMYQQAIDACPSGHDKDLATFYQNKAAAHEQLKRWQQVIADCSSALELNEKYEKALFRRAKAYEIQSDWEKCLEDITAVCLIQGFHNPTSMQMADRALKQLGKQHAKEAMKTKKPTLASKQFVKTYMMSFPADPVYQMLMDKDTLDESAADDVKGFLRAKQLYAKGDFDNVIAACSEEIDSSEAESRYHFEALSLRASFHFLSGSWTECLDDIEAIISSKDSNALIKLNARLKRASLLMQAGNIEKCLEDFAEAEKLGPDVADVFHHRGQIHLLLEHTSQAREDFERAVSLNPNFAIAVVQKYYADYRYAVTMQNMSLLMDSLANFRNATRRFKDFSETFVLFGQVLCERQEFDEAVSMFAKALKVDPENATILVHRGMLELQWHGDIEKGVEYMRKATQLDDRCGFAFETLGTVEVQRGNLIIAIELFNKAIELARTEIEMTHLFSLRDAAVAQLKMCTRLNIGPTLQASQ